MTAALRWLLVREARGRVRRLLRRMRTPKGAIGAVFFVLLLALVAAPQVMRLMVPEMERALRANPETVRTFGPAFLVVVAVLGALSGRALSFTPAEIGFLFPAPVARRALLLHNLASRLAIQVLSALWTAMFMLQHAPHAAFGLAGLVLAFMWAYAAAQALALVRLRVEARLPPWLLRTLVVVGLGGVLVGVVLGLAEVPWKAGAAAAGRVLTTSPPLRAVGMPARAFAELFLADGWGDALRWGAACLGVLALSIGAVLALDAPFAERSVEVSTRMAERRRRAAAGGTPFEPSRSGRKPPVPRLAFLGPAGALAWRQLMELGRNRRALLTVVATAAVWSAALLGPPLLQRAREGIPVSTGDALTAMAMAAVFPVVFTAQLGFDFRRDLDRIPYLRSLPLTPLQVAVGQILPGTLVFMALQLAICVAVAAATRAVPPFGFVAAMLALPPFTWASVAVENALFLLMPARATAEGVQDVQFVGKTMVLLVLKTLVVGLLLAVAALVMAGTAKLTGAGWPVGLAVASLVLAALCIPLTWTVAALFARFDLTRDAPA